MSLPRSPLPRLALCALLLVQLAGCATPYDSEKSFWNGQTGFSQTQLGPNKWQLEFVGNDLVDRELARKYVLKRAGEMALARGHAWVNVQELTLARDPVRVSPTRPQFGFDEYEPDTFMDEMHVEHRTSALLTFSLGDHPLNDRSLEASYLAKMKTNSD
ncbi:CC0125/CC1285 family lipoprotein [Aeromonas sp. NJAU223]|uniref:CC0125/CC1285 family lipoprotein n=1 Tax=Aeromonas sp. NJAU223 TaxID=3115650 RepID=UPI003DA8E1DC